MWYLVTHGAQSVNKDHKNLKYLLNENSLKWKQYSVKQSRSYNLGAAYFLSEGGPFIPPSSVCKLFELYKAPKRAKAIEKFSSKSM